MNRHSFLKSGYTVVAVLAVVGSCYMACETKRPTSTETTSHISTVVKGKIYSFETIKPELQKLLDYLISNPQIITPAALAKAAERHATVADLGLSDKFPGEFPLENGNTFEVYVELFDGSVGAGASIEDAEVYFTLDLDRYPDDAELSDRGSTHTFQAHMAATAYNMSKGLLAKEESSQQLSLQSTTEKVNYFLFFVGGEERLSDANEEKIYQEMVVSASARSKSQQFDPTIYVWLVRLYFNADNDWGDEEFELYYGNGSGATNPFGASTIWLFDGRSHVDASGVSRFFPDVNTRDVLYKIPHAIALAPYTSSFKCVAIEDDCSSGAHKNDHSGGGKHNHYVFGVNIATGFFQGQFPFWIHDDCSNDDDIYTESVIAHPGLTTPGCGIFYPRGEFSDVVYTLRRGTVANADSNWAGAPSCY